MVIVDTSVWIQAFNVDASLERRQVDSLLARGQVAIAGVILTEVLQGARTESAFMTLYDRLSEVPYLEDTRQTWVAAGRLAYTMKRAGVKLPLQDLVIAILVMEGNHEVYTLDEHFEQIPGLKLHSAGRGIEEERK